MSEQEKDLSPYYYNRKPCTCKQAVEYSIEESKKDPTPHYYRGKYCTCRQAIESILENSPLPPYIAFCIATAIPYLWRAGKKDDLKQDLKKARDWIDFAIQSLED